MDALRTDLRYALRAIRRSPAFSLVAVLVIGLGCGGVTAVFSVVDAVLLRPLPGATSPDRLVSAERTRADGDGSLSASYPYYEALRDGTRTLSGVAAWSNAELAVGTGEGVVSAYGNIVSGNYFDVLGVRPALGRFFLPEEDGAPLAHPVVVVSYEFWRSRLGADPSRIGADLLVDGRPFTLVGVAPPGFRGAVTPLRTDAWVLLAMQPLVRPGRERTDPEAAWLRVIGRLREGVGREAVRRDLEGLTRAYVATSREGEELRAFTGVRVSPVTGLPDDARRAAFGFLTLLLGAAGMVLVIASVNVAGMLSARALRRGPELAVRSALGASRSGLVRLLLTETSILFLAGAGVGLALARSLLVLLPRIPLPVDAPVALDPSLDWRVLAFGLAVPLMAGLAFGIAPALRGVRSGGMDRLRSASAGSPGRRFRGQRVLVAGQLALSLVLLVGAGLLARALQRGRTIDPGFDVHGVATVALNSRSWGYDEARARAFFQRVRRRVEAVPSVTSVSTSGFLPLAFGSSGAEVEVGDAELPVQFATVDRGYFQVLRLPLLEGRGFTEADDPSAPAVAVVNRTLARRAWPDGSAVGRTFVFHGRTVRVVGVAEDAKYASLNESTPAYLYLPMEQFWTANQWLLVRGAGDPAALATPLRSAIHELDPALPPPPVSTLRRETGVVLLPQRIAASVTGGLGGLGLLLAAVGLFGVMSYSAAGRSREIGVRMALGARRRDVVGLFVGQGVRMAGAGVLVGLVGAAAAARLLQSLLFGLGPLDAFTYVAACGVLLGAAALASYLPARRAAAVDPMRVLREE